MDKGGEEGLVIVKEGEKERGKKDNSTKEYKRSRGERRVCRIWLRCRVNQVCASTACELCFGALCVCVLSTKKYV
jgi:hypothetical protein